MDTEEVVCNICMSSDYEERLYPIKSGHLVKCARCDLYYASPRRTDFIQKVTSGNTDGLYEPNLLNYWGRLVKFNRLLQKICSYKSPPGKLLDISSSDGLFLYEARKYGFEPYGIEANAGAATYAKEWLKLNVNQGWLDKNEFPDAFFDVVTMFESLEHAPDPSTMLRIIRRIMKDDGLLCIAVPVIPFYLNFVKSRWRMFIVDHYYFFTENSMSRLMEKSDFSYLDSYYLSQSVDIGTVTTRLADDEQPNNLGVFGKVLKRTLDKMKLGDIRLPVKLFDIKMFMFTPDCSGK